LDFSNGRLNIGGNYNDGGYSSDFYPDGLHFNCTNTSINAYCTSFNVYSNIKATGEITAYSAITSYSDRRLKSNIKPLENRGYIQPMTYIKDNKECIGFIAQDV
jgi:hypothetical protein